MQFREMMRGELWRYSRRELVNVLAFSDSEDFKSTVMMLKIMDIKLTTEIMQSEKRMMKALGVSPAQDSLESAPSDTSLESSRERVGQSRDTTNREGVGGSA